MMNPSPARPSRFQFSSRLRHVALLLAMLSPMMAPAPQAFAAPAATIQTNPPTLDDFKKVLTGFGRFVYSERYGNVWQPSSLPAGWHPYPACHWVYDRSYGWTYDDPSPWGKIVHHYGRWAHDNDAGWVWVPGTEWSPAWVIWRAGVAWTGWAPTPPATDQQEVTLASFNSDKQWTFIETAKLANRCDSEPAAAPSGTMTATSPVTTIKMVRGIAVYVLPQPDTVTVIDFDTGPIAPWSSAFLGDWITWLSTIAPASLTMSGSAAICPPAVAPAVAPAAYPSAPPPAPTKKTGKKIRKAVYPLPTPTRPTPPVIVDEDPGVADPGPRIYTRPPRYYPPRPIYVPQRPYPGSYYPSRPRPRYPTGGYGQEQMLR
jgi:hypothetical protein